MLEIECVDAGGSLWRLGTQDAHLDLRGLVVGSEGTLAVVTAVEMRLVEQPSDQSTIVAAFDENVSAIEAVRRIFETGASPIALDMVSRVFHPDGKAFSFPNRALLFIETAGSAETVLRETDANGYFLFDSVVRRSDLSAAMGKLEEIARSFGFVLANTFHAGDGNIHPTPFFDRRDPGHTERLGAFLRQVMSEVRERDGEAIVVSTKVSPSRDPADPFPLDRTRIEESVKRSIERLGRDRIDLLQLHRLDPATSPSSTRKASVSPKAARRAPATGRPAS